MLFYLFTKEYRLLHWYKKPHLDVSCISLITDSIKIEKVVQFSFMKWFFMKKLLMKEISIFCTKYSQVHVFATGPPLGHEVNRIFLTVPNIRRYLKS